MVINIIKDNKSDSKQPVVYDLGTVTSTLQALLDVSKITITDKQVILLKVTQLDTTVSYYFLPFRDYNGDSLYGYGKEIVVSDLIPISGGGGAITIPTIAQVLNAGYTSNVGANLVIPAVASGSGLTLGGSTVSVSSGFASGNAITVTPTEITFINSGTQAQINVSGLSNNKVFRLPNCDNTSTRILPVTVNGNFADATGNIVIATESSSIIERGVFSGAFALTSGIGGEYTPLTQSGALTFSAGGSAVNGGIDSVKITANGSAITVPGGWINIGSDAISTVNGAINRIMVRQYQSEIWYTVKVN